MGFICPTFPGCYLNYSHSFQTSVSSFRSLLTCSPHPHPHPLPARKDLGPSPTFPWGMKEMFACHVGWKVRTKDPFSLPSPWVCFHVYSGAKYQQRGRGCVGGTRQLNGNSRGHPPKILKFKSKTNQIFQRHRFVPETCFVTPRVLQAVLINAEDIPAVGLTRRCYI